MSDVSTVRLQLRGQWMIVCRWVSFSLDTARVVLVCFDFIHILAICIGETCVKIVYIFCCIGMVCVDICWLGQPVCRLPNP